MQHKESACLGPRHDISEEMQVTSKSPSGVIPSAALIRPETTLDPRRTAEKIRDIHGKRRSVNCGCRLGSENPSVQDEKSRIANGLAEANANPVASQKGGAYRGGTKYSCRVVHHPCARAMLIFSVSFQFYRMISVE